MGRLAKQVLCLEKAYSLTQGIIIPSSSMMSYQDLPDGSKGDILAYAIVHFLQKHHGVVQS